MSNDLCAISVARRSNQQRNSQNERERRKKKKEQQGAIDLGCDPLLTPFVSTLSLLLVLPPLPPPKKKKLQQLPRAVTLQKLFSVRMFVLPGPTLLKDEACLYLANHRSWADFFLDVVATDGRAQMLSRAAVAVAFPAFMLAVCVIRSVILFRRDNVKDFNAFNAMIESRIKASPVDGLIVYPEGHRSTKAKPLPLKKGMLQFAWSRKIAVQVVASSGKEGVISEKATSARWGRRVVVAYSVPIRPADHADFESFFARVVDEWVATWNRVAREEAAALKSASAMPELKLDNRQYPGWMLRAQVLVTGATVCAFLTTCFCSARFFVRRVESLPEILRLPAVLALGCWCAGSVVRARGEPPCPPINGIGTVDAKEFAEVMAAEAAASKRRRSLKELNKSDSGRNGNGNEAAAANAAASDLADANGG